ncbi:acetoin utilization protein AcuC [Cohnella sp. GCM10027633]|uniref:acetoin utilization protein AcuC n=1 Tax=unclassified Cohnella TaxID=2636738 RepID=UPI0036390D6D
MSARALWIDNTASGRYRFSEQHPFHPIRLALAEELLRMSGALDVSRALAPAGIEEAREIVSRIHRTDYVDAVAALSASSPSAEALRDAAKYGLDADGDTPSFEDMEAASLQVVAGSLAAAEAVMSGATNRALHLAGGLHHAFPDKAAGFCVFNDAAAAISRIRERYGARVLYIDTDVHHGDGVQWFYYDDPDVFTLSIHETGKFLFPGTGFHHERGHSSGYGACLNLPVEPYTEDDSWLELFRIGVERAVSAFKPDVIVSQHGCDAHAFDPLAHVHCSMRIYREMPRLIRELADRHAGGKWIALGGGGYDHWRVVPRAWSLLWLEMSEHPLLEEIDRSPLGGRLPDGWPSIDGPSRPRDLPGTWLDDVAAWTPMPRRTEITEKNKAMLDIALQHLG